MYFKIYLKSWEWGKILTQHQRLTLKHTQRCIVLFASLSLLSSCTYTLSVLKVKTIDDLTYSRKSPITCQDTVLVFVGSAIMLKVFWRTWKVGMTLHAPNKDIKMNSTSEMGEESTWRCPLKNKQQQKPYFNVYGHLKKIQSIQVKLKTDYESPRNGTIKAPQMTIISSLINCLWRQRKPQNITNGAIKVKQKIWQCQMWRSFGCRNLRKIQLEQYRL